MSLRRRNNHQRPRVLDNNDLHYLRSILGNLREVRTIQARQHKQIYRLGDEVLADNIDWLDCFIDKHFPRGGET